MSAQSKLQDLSNTYDGPIPLREKRIAEFGSHEAYMEAFNKQYTYRLKQMFRSAWQARKAQRGNPEMFARQTKYMRELLEQIAGVQ